MKNGSRLPTFGSKGRRSTFKLLSGCTDFPTGYLKTSWSVCLPTLYTDSGWWKKDAQKVWGQTVIDQGLWKRLINDFANFSVLCQLRRFTNAVCYQYLIIVLLFWNTISSPYLFSTFILSGSRDIVQVVQTIQIDLPTFRFTEPGSNLAFVPQNIVSNVDKMQKGHVIAFYKIIQLPLVQRFLWDSVYVPCTKSQYNYSS